MKICEEDLIFTEEGIFCGQGLLHLNDKVSGECGGMIRHHFGPGLFIFLVRITGSDSRLFFHQHLVAALDELINGRGKQGHSRFLGFDLFRDTDDHGRKLERFLPRASQENEGLAGNRF